MKIYVPATLLELFTDQLTTIVGEPNEADVVLLFIEENFDSTSEEYLRVKESSHLVLITKSNIHRRFIPDDLEYDLCCNVRSKKNYTELIVDLNAAEWKHAPSKAVKKKTEKVNSIKLASEKLKEEKAELQREKEAEEERLRQEKSRLEQERREQEQQLWNERMRLETERRAEEERLRLERLQLAQEKESVEEERLRLAESSSEKKSQCVVCLDAVITVSFKPCGHACTCHVCATGCKKCPMCRQWITGGDRIYIA